MGDTVTLDFTNVKEGGTFSKKRLPAGDFKARVTKFEVTKVKKGDNKGNDQWLFTVAVEGRHGATYPYYCQLEENQLWKIRNLLVAAGKNVPKKRLKVDPRVVVGKLIGITLDDSEYEGREQSEITAVFPPSEVDGDTVPDDDDDDDDDDVEDDEEEEAPKKSTKKKLKKKAAPEPDEDDEDDDDEGSEDDDEDDDEDEEEEAPKKSKKKSKKKNTKNAPHSDDDDDEDIDELDIEDL